MQRANEEVEQRSAARREDTFERIIYRARDPNIIRLRDPAFRLEVIKNTEHNVCKGLHKRGAHGPVSAAWFAWAVDSMLWDVYVLRQRKERPRVVRPFVRWIWSYKNKRPGRVSGGPPYSAAWMRFCEAAAENFPLTKAQIDTVFASDAPFIADREQTAAFLDRLLMSPAGSHVSNATALAVMARYIATEPVDGNKKNREVQGQGQGQVISLPIRTVSY